MQGRNSVFNQQQIQELQIENFIYHIIKSELDEPDYLDEVVLNGQSQIDFFKKIISEATQGTQYSFINSNPTTLKDECALIIDAPDSRFNESSKLIAENFLSYHNDERTSDGVLIIARVSTLVHAQRKSFIALIKLDYTPVMRQRITGQNGRRVELEEIIDALSEDPSAIQKRALIDVSDSFIWDVLAVERKKGGRLYDTEEAISLYFKNFLGVRLRQNDSSITKDMVKHCYRWARGYDGDLEGKTATDIRQSVIELLDAYDGRQINYHDIRDHVCAHRNQSEIERMGLSFDNYMSELGYAGISFSPKPKSIGKSERKGEWETDSGIKITWTGERNPNLLSKESQTDGSVIITIKANEIKERE